MNRTLLNVSRVAVVLAFFVITIGAYTRLSDAGLGCPDWPGCYGQMLVPEHTEHVEKANQAYPDRPVEQAKAWKEMIHRYVAGTLGLLILAICVLAWLKTSDSRTRVFGTALLMLVIFQALLGMWTVTLLLKPVVVMAHLLGGMTIISLLYWLALRQQVMVDGPRFLWQTNLRGWAIIGLIILACQISLGGWTSSNYAALACPDFPTCQGEVWPNMDFKEGFVLWRGLGIDYEFGVLDGPARTAIHMAHRIVAVVTFVVLLLVAIRALKNEVARNTGLAMLLLLLLQISLGIANVVMHLPLSVAVAHNGVAALLLLSLVRLLHQSLPMKSN